MSKALMRLYFALNEALEVYKDSSVPILMDCTCKTNRFDLPMLNMIGLTGMNATIHLAQAFVRGETFDDYIWALSQLRVTWNRKTIHLPQVIFVDRDQAQLKPLEAVFPTVPVLLYLWQHIA